MALVPTALGAIQIDDVQPPNNTASTSNPYLPQNANISGQESVTVGIDSSTEWLAGTLDADTIVGTGGTLQLRRVDRDDFSGTGDPDSTLWTWNNIAQQGLVNGILSLDSDMAAGDDYTRIDATTQFDLATMDGLTLDASSSIVSSDMFAFGFLLGWWAGGTGMDSYVGIGFQEDGAGGYYIDLIANDPNYGYQQGSGFSYMVNPGSFEQYRITVSNGSAGEVIGEWFDATSQMWVSLGMVYLDLASFGPYNAWAGTDYPVFADFAIDIDYIAVGVTLYAASGTYESAPIDTGLYAGAYISVINLTTNDGLMSGIGAVQWQTAPNDTGPWSGWQTAPVNLGVDLASNTWVQFQISLSRSPQPSWPDAVMFTLAYKTDVGTYFLDDFPGSGTLNTDSWTASSGELFGEGLDLNSGSGSSSVGVTYRNDSWLISDAHHVETLAAVRVVDGNSVALGGLSDDNVLLSGFLSSDGFSQTGYVGVVRLDDSVDAYWGVAWDDGSGGMLDYDMANMIQTSGQAIIRAELDDGVFRAWVIEVDNAWRGWLDLGSFAWGAASGTAWWRMGDVGSHAGSQRAVVDWAALELKAMTPVFGAAWTAGNVDLNQNENTRAVIAFSGPTWALQRVTYRLDTTAPTGTLTLNDGNGFTTRLTVNLTVDATDRYGVSFYAASESLSFPEGWTAMSAYPHSTTFSLSPGDGRKVVWVRYLDTSGVASAPINASVVLDSQNPSGAIYIADRSAYSNTIDVPVTLLAFDGNGVDTLYLSNDAGMANKVAFDVNPGPGPAPPSTSETRTWTLAPGDGTKTVYYQVEDVAGRMSQIFNDSILVDTTAPGLTATLVNGVVRGNTTYVSTSRLVVNVEASDASGVEEVDISEDAAFADFVSYTGPGTLTYDVAAVSGAKTLWVRAYDIYGLLSAVRRLDFFVDVNAPTGSIEILYTGQTEAEFRSNIPGCCNDVNLAKARGVVLVVSAVDNVGVSELQFSTSLYFPGAVWQPFVPGLSSRYYFELSANDGTDKTMYVRFKDINGNPSQAFFDQIDMDTTPPTGEIIVNSGDESTIDPLLSLSLVATDNFEGDLQMRLSLTPDFNGSTWLPFTDTARFDARTTAGRVTVYFQVKDANGWESRTESDNITVRQPTCQELNNCPLVGSPGFEGGYAGVALAAVAAVALVARRRRGL